VSGQAGTLPPSPTPRRNGEVRIAREFGMFVFLRLVILFTVLWAFVGSLFYGYLLDYLGWNKTGLEARWTLFIALSLIVPAVTTAFLIGAYQLLVRICRPFSRKGIRSSG